MPDKTKGLAITVRQARAARAVVIWYNNGPEVSPIADHYRRDNQLLPFVRQQFTPPEIRTLLGVIEHVQCDTAQSSSAKLGGLLLHCSLETGFHVRDFLPAPQFQRLDGSKNSKPFARYEKPLVELVVRSERSPNQRQGLHLLPTGVLAWYVHVPRSNTLDAHPPIHDDPRLASEAWLPVSTQVQDLVQLVVDPDHGLENVKHANPLSVLQPFAKICERLAGLRIDEHFVNRVSRSLASQIANAPRGDAAQAKIATGQFVRETGATSHYTHVKQRDVMRTCIEVGERRKPPASYPSIPALLSPAIATVIDAGARDTTRKKKAKKPVKQSELIELRNLCQQNLSAARMELEQLQLESGVITAVQLRAVCRLHNWFTLYLWLRTSVSIGARLASKPLLNPAAVMTGGLVLINDKGPKFDESGTIDPNPTTRIAAIPDGLEQQIHAYEAHLAALKRHVLVRPFLTRERVIHRPKHRFEPFFLIENTADGEQPRAPLRAVKAGALLSKASAIPEDPDLLEALGELRSNKWRRFLRTHLLPLVPHEMINAILGHWHNGEGPWWLGAALDPLQTWSRIKHALDQLMPPSEWYVETGLPGVFPELACSVVPEQIAPKGPAFAAEDADQQDLESLLPSQRGPHYRKARRDQSFIDLHDLFDADDLYTIRLGLRLEQAHLALLEKFMQMRADLKDDANSDLIDLIPDDVWAGHLLMSAILWAGLLDGDTWLSWLNAVLTRCVPLSTSAGYEHGIGAREQAEMNPIDLQAIEFYSEKAGFPQAQHGRLYHDPITVSLLQLTRVSLAGRRTPLAVEGKSAEQLLTAWLRTTDLKDETNEVLSALTGALELRARLRLPAAVVDYATGKEPSTCIADAQRANMPAPGSHLLKLNETEGRGLGQVRGMLPAPFESPINASSFNDDFPLLKAVRIAIDNIKKLPAGSQSDRYSVARAFRKAMKAVIPQSAKVDWTGRVVENPTKIRTFKADQDRILSTRFDIAVYQETYRRAGRGQIGEKLKRSAAKAKFLEGQICCSGIQRRAGDWRIEQLLSERSPKEVVMALLGGDVEGHSASARKAAGELLNLLCRYKQITDRNFELQSLADAQDSMEIEKTSPIRMLINSEQFQKIMAVLAEPENYNPSYRQRSTPLLPPVSNDNDQAEPTLEKKTDLTPFDPRSRYSDITRVAAILMYRAGVRPLELSSLKLKDFLFAIEPDTGRIESAELLITANEM